MGCCETLTGIVKDCDSGLGGVKRFWVICFDDTADINLTITSNQVTKLLPEEGENKWKSYVVNELTSYVTQTFAYNQSVGTRYWDTEIFMQFAHLTLAKQIEIDALTKSDVWIIVQDKNNDFWLLGDKEDWVYATAATVETGTAIDDLSGYTITWSYQSKIPMYSIDPAAMAELLPL